MTNMGPVEQAKLHQVLPSILIEVQIKDNLLSEDNCRGFFVNKKNIETRRPNEVGTYRGYVSGAGGDVWWIEHKDGTIGAYSVDELTDVK